MSNSLEAMYSVKDEEFVIQSAFSNSDIANYIVAQCHTEDFCFGNTKPIFDALVSICTRSQTPDHNTVWNELLVSGSQLPYASFRELTIPTGITETNDTRLHQAQDRLREHRVLRSVYNATCKTAHQIKDGQICAQDALGGLEAVLDTLRGVLVRQDGFRSVFK